MKGVVLEVKNGYAAVLKEDGTVAKLRGLYAVGDTVQVPAGAAGWRRYLQTAIAAVLVFAILTVGGYSYQNVLACSYVTLDVSETSIEYTLNRRNQVIGVAARNDASQAAAETLDQTLRRKDLADAIQETMDYLEGQLDGGDCALVAVTADSDHRAEQLVQAVDGVAGPGEMEFFTASPEERRAAQADGMSTGRWQLKQRFGEDPQKDFRNGDMDDLMGRGPRPGGKPDGPGQQTPGQQSPAQSGQQTPGQSGQQSPVGQQTPAQSGQQTPTQSGQSGQPGSQQDQEKAPQTTPAVSTPSQQGQSAGKTPAAQSTPVPAVNTPVQPAQSTQSTAKPAQTVPAQPTQTAPVQPTQTAQPVQPTQTVPGQTTDKPVQTAPGQATDRPDQTAQPVQSADKPAQTAPGQTMDKPDQTAQPVQSTDKPNQTAPGQTADKPAQTAQPDPDGPAAPNASAGPGQTERQADAPAEGQSQEPLTGRS